MIARLFRRTREDAASAERVLLAAFANVGDRYAPKTGMEREMCEDMYRKGYLISYLWYFERAR